jgi:hypothetical protein
MPESMPAPEPEATPLDSVSEVAIADAKPEFEAIVEVESSVSESDMPEATQRVFEQVDVAGIHQAPSEETLSLREIGVAPSAPSALDLAEPADMPQTSDLAAIELESLDSSGLQDEDSEASESEAIAPAANTPVGDTPENVV